MKQIFEEILLCFNEQYPNATFHQPFMAMQIAANLEFELDSQNTGDTHGHLCNECKMEDSTKSI